MMTVGMPPFSQASVTADPIYKLIAEKNWVKYWNMYENHVGKQINSDLKTLLEGMLDHDPDTRITSEEIVALAWLKDG
jgi:serine/threonine protein kinase